MQAILLKDSLGRILLQSDGRRCLLSRFPGMDKDTQVALAEIFAETTGRELATVKKFLSFESEIQELCS